MPAEALVPLPAALPTEVQAASTPAPVQPAAEDKPPDVIDAVVLDEPASAALPVASLLPAQPAIVGGSLPSAGLRLGGWARWLEAQPAKYMVPRRFGMSAILGMMTALALLFGLLRRLDAHPGFYLFFGLLGLVICIAQMLNNARPRVASVVAGAILVPLSFFATVWWDPHRPPLLFLLCLVFFYIPFGAFLGYLAGTLAAGVFLLVDRVEQWWTGRATALPEAEHAAREDAPAGQAP